MANIVDVTYLSYFFRVSDRRIQQWVNEGMPREDRGEYNFVKCVDWRIKYLENKIEELQSGDEKLYQLKREGQALANRERELKLRKLAGELVILDDVKLAWVEEVKTFNKLLDSLQNKLDTAIGGEGKYLPIIAEKINEIRTMLPCELRINLDELDDQDEVSETEVIEDE